MTDPKLGLIVLCGGQSRRMGSPKAWLPFGDETLLQRLIRIGGVEVAPGPVVVAAGGHKLPNLPSATILVHDPLPDLGPLQGLATGLAALVGNVDFAYTTGVDTPFLPPGWIHALADWIGHHDVILPITYGQPHPLAALYRPAPALTAARILLDSGERRLSELVRSLNHRVLSSAELEKADPAGLVLANINTREEYLLALRQAGIADPGSNHPR